MVNLIIHTDGGSRGNPGPAAAGFVADIGEQRIFESSRYLGITTNNIAEYSAVILATEWLIKYLEKNKVDSVLFVLDSELVVKQLIGKYKVKHPEIKKVYMEVKKNIGKIPVSIDFSHVLRKDNKFADEIVNRELDSNS